MALARISVAWQNWPGAPGVTQLYYELAPTQAFIDGIRAYFQALNGNLPSGLTIQVPSSGDVLSEQTGQLSGTWSVGSTPAVVTGSNVGTYAGNAGAVCHWLTAGVINGRRVRGRTFIVPAVGVYETNGSISAAFLTTLGNAADALITASAGDMMVWARPRPGLSGSMHAVTSRRVPDLAVSLRSRRI